MINNIEELIAEFNNTGKSQTDLHRQNFTTGYSLEILKDKIMPLLENPQDNLKIVHIAGTSGKGSTTAYIANLLAAHGFKIAFTQSPYVIDFRERFQILSPDKPFFIKKNSNNRVSQYKKNFIQEKKIVRYYNQIKPIFDKFEKDVKILSYYEKYIALLFHIANMEEVDYLVLETSLGGLKDATNLSTRQDKVCVINQIGLDHQDLLGDAIEEIAQDKAGIIQAGNLVFKSDQKEVNRIFESTSKSKNAELKIVKIEKGLDINQSLSMQVLYEVLKRAKIDLNLDKTDDILYHLYIPGRFDLFDEGKFRSVSKAKNGIIFYKQDAKTISDAIKLFEKTKFETKIISDSALPFASDIFKSRIKFIVDNL